MLTTHSQPISPRRTRAQAGKIWYQSQGQDQAVYVIGKTAWENQPCSKTWPFRTFRMARAMAFIDPHGKTADLFSLTTFQHTAKRTVVYFAPFDLDYPISFNVLEQVDPDKRHLVVPVLCPPSKNLAGRNGRRAWNIFDQHLARPSGISGATFSASTACIR